MGGLFRGTKNIFGELANQDAKKELYTETNQDKEAGFQTKI
jgi:hypothetical protein